MGWNELGDIAIDTLELIESDFSFDGYEILRVSQEFDIDKFPSGYLSLRFLYPDFGVYEFKKIYPSLEQKDILLYPIPTELKEIDATTRKILVKASWQSVNLTDCNWVLSFEGWQVLKVEALDFILTGGLLENAT